MRMIRRPYALGAGLLLAIAGWSIPARAQQAGLQAALRDFDPDARLTDEANLVQRADFDGDGREDVAAVVASGSRRALVAFNATGSGYQAHPLFTGLPPGDTTLRLLPPGKYRILGPQPTVQTDVTAIELIFPGKSSAMYVWRGERYRVFATESFLQP